MTQDWNMVSEIEVTYKSKIKPSQRPLISSTKNAYELLIHHWDTNKMELLEQAKAILLSRANRVLGLLDISSGGQDATVMDHRILLVSALKTGAASIILAHNHPSGKLQPSEQDRTVTTKIAEACRFHNMLLLDHIILTTEGYYSFADEGLL